MSDSPHSAKVIVVLDSGRQKTYELKGVTEDDLAQKARAHAQAIATKGYRAHDMAAGTLTHYGPTRIRKVVVVFDNTGVAERT